MTYTLIIDLLNSLSDFYRKNALVKIWRLKWWKRGYWDGGGRRQCDLLRAYVIAKIMN
jgi:hypothetical protein